VHLLVTFVTVKSSAEGFRRWMPFRFQSRQPPEQHIDLAYASLVRRVRLIGLAGIFREHVAPDVYQKKPRLNGLTFSIDLKLNALVATVQINLEQLEISQEFGAGFARSSFKF